MQTLVEYAGSEGIRELRGEVLPDNSTMLRMCAELGFDIADCPADPAVRTVTLPIKPTP
jgi:acetyltransferase